MIFASTKVNVVNALLCGARASKQGKIAFVRKIHSACDRQPDKQHFGLDISHMIFVLSMLRLLVVRKERLCIEDVLLWGCWYI